MALNEQEIRRKALAGIALTNPTGEATKLYDSFKPQAQQQNTGQAQYPTIGTITNAPTASNIELSKNMQDEIARKANTGEALTNWSAQKQEMYNGIKNKAPTYNDFTYKDAPTYDSKYQSQIDNALQNLLAATGNFSYNYKNDPLFNQYQETYQREGDRALTNSMAQATALSGGRMNSNAIVAGQQAQNYYNQQLGDKIPELEQYAYQKYVQELANQRNNIGTMGDLENMMFGQYQTELGQFNTDRNMAYTVNGDKNNYNYQNYRDTQAYDRNVIESDRNYDYNLWQTQNALGQDQRNYDYQVGRDQVADGQWDKTFDRGVLESDRGFNYGVSRDQVGDSQWKQTFDRGNYEYDTSRQDNLSQQAIANALNDYKAKNSSTSSSTSKSGMSYSQYLTGFKGLLSQVDGNDDPMYTKDEVKDQVLELYDSGELTQQEAENMIKSLGLWGGVK